MIQSDFDEICKQLDAERHKIVAMKRPEYTEGREDVLHNFNQLARELNVTPLQVAFIFFRKHVASIGQICANPKSNTSSEPFSSRICDAMNYLELIYALSCEL